MEIGKSWKVFWLGKLVNNYNHHITGNYIVLEILN